jgi:hypothetical protein
VFTVGAMPSPIRVNLMVINGMVYPIKKIKLDNTHQSIPSYSFYLTWDSSLFRRARGVRIFFPHQLTEK